MSGETRARVAAVVAQRFLKHRDEGTLYAVAMDNTGEVREAVVVTEATACVHTLGAVLAEAPAAAAEAELLNGHLDEFDVFEPRCENATHLLADLGRQEQVCQVARNAWLVARSHAKELKEALEKDEARLRLMVREATTAEQPGLPLFEAAS